MSPERRADIAERTRRAGAFAQVAGEYERGRPGYPHEAIAWLLGTEPLDVLDLGAGTGKLTGALLASGHRVSAVEPLPEMRAILTDTLPAARALPGSAEALPLADHSVDAVAVGAAFHWFDRGAALAEIRRVLRPPGVLGLLGNSFDVTLPWVARVREILGPPALERPGHWPSREALREEFAEVEDQRFPHEQPLDRARLRDLACSRSNVAVMADPQRERLLASLDRLWELEPTLRGHTEVPLPWCAIVRRCTRLRGRGPGDVR
jgi:SAM-dependent methyltransferase